MSRINAQSLQKFWTKETPSGAINGSNTAFTLAQLPLENEAVELFLDGLRLDEGVDYSLSSQNITMTTAPAVGQTLRATYIRAKGE